MKANLRQRPIDDINLSLHRSRLNDLLNEAERRLERDKHKLLSDGLDTVFLWLFAACLGTAALLVYAVEQGWM
jgi:hypothetical protein